MYLKLTMIAALFLFIGMLHIQESMAQVPTPTWHQVGDKINIGGDPSGYPENSISISPLNIPYIAYKNRLTGFNLFSGWQAAPISNMRTYVGRPVWSPMVQPDYQDPIRSYVAFLTSVQSNIAQDPGVSLYVRRYNPATGLFTTIGNERVGRTFSPDYKPYSYVTANDGSVYVAFLEYVVHGLYRTTVKKFDGANWVVLGAPQFSPNGEGLDIRLLADGTPVFGYWSFGDGVEAAQYVLVKFNDVTNEWDAYPQLPVATSTRIDVATDGSLFAVSVNNSNIRDLVFIVHKWNDVSNEWEDMGGFPRSAYSGNRILRNLSLVIKSDNEGNPAVMYVMDNTFTDQSDYGFSKVVRYNPDNQQWEYMLRCNDANVCTSRINDDSHNIGPGKIHDIDFDSFNNPWVIVHTGNNGSHEYTQQVLRWGCESLDFIAPELHSPLNASGPYSFDSMPLVWEPTPANCFNQTPDTYHIEVATDAGFANITHSASPLNPGDFQIVNGRWVYRADALIPNTTYFWRVRPHNSANWSAVWSFTTDAVVAGADWERVNAPLGDVNLRSVFALTANHFYVGTDDGRVFFTTNGGATYTQAVLSPAVNTPINDITLFSGNRLAIATESGVQIAERSLAGTYEAFQQTGNYVGAINKTYFNWSGNAGFAVRRNGQIGKFALDNNNQWVWTSHPIGLALEPHAIGFRRSPSQSTGFVVGDALNLGILPRTGLFRTTDMGFSYIAFGQQNNVPTITGLGNFPVNFYDLAVTMEPGDERWLAIGSKESVYASIPNPGNLFEGDIVVQNWVQLIHAGRNPNLSFRAVELYHAGGADNQHTGFVVGDDGKIIRTRFDEIAQVWMATQMGWNTFNNLWDVHITGNFDGNWDPIGPQYAYTVGDRATILRYQLEQPQGIEFVCEADLVIDSPFPSFNWGITGAAPVSYTVSITENGNLVLEEDTPNSFFSVSAVRLKHQHEYSLSITANYAGRSGTPVSCNFAINDPVIHVNKALGAGVGDGTSWISAYRELTTALDVLVDGQQVWVAAGTYTPSPGVVDRSASFVIDGLQNVALLGGFAGFEAEADQRDFESNPTTLSGDLLGNDNAADFNTRDDNSYQVLVIQNTSNTVQVDGFSIISGTANSIGGPGSGGGIYMKNSDAHLSNLSIENNFASLGGGGLQIDGSFDGGTGVVTYNSRPYLEAVTFVNNASENTIVGGSAINLNFAHPTINRSLFTQNKGEHAVVAVVHYASVTVVNSIFANNEGVSIRGIADARSEYLIESINNTFSGNGVSIGRGSKTTSIKNSILNQFFSFGGGADGPLSVQNSLLRFDLPMGANDLGGNIIGLNPRFDDSDTIPGGLGLNGCSPALNSGSSALYPNSIAPVDFFGLPRIQGGGRIDMGAIETQTDPGGCGIWDVLVDVEDILPGRSSIGTSRTLVFGMAENATDGYDSGLDQLAPPMPPFGVFDVRFINGAPPVHYFKDFRPESELITEWTLLLTPSTASTGLKLSWNASEVAALSGSLELRYGTMFIQTVNMSSESSVTLPADVGTVTLRFTPTLPVEVELSYTLGWNLVSVPATPEDNTAASFFPSMEPGTFFGFNNSYTDETVFTAGRGYWVLLTQSQETTLTEDLVNVLSISLNEGWNLTGSVAQEVFVSAISDPDFILSMSSIYEYDPFGGYVNPSSIMPGKGYWMRAMSAGTITLGSTSSGIGTSGVLASAPDFSGFHRLDVQHGDGAPRTFYLGGQLTDELPSSHSYELPPMPPVGAYDVRLQNHTWLTEIRETAVLVQSASERITLAFEASHLEPDQEMVMTIHRSGGLTEDYQLWSGDSVTVEGTGITKVEVSVNTTVGTPGTGNELPLAVELAQNYPNPFNPTTNITFGLPESGSVRLDVYNVMGQRVATLVNDQKPAGYHTVTFDASRLASGTYLYRLQTGNQVITKKLMLVK